MTPKEKAIEFRHKYQSMMCNTCNNIDFYKQASLIAIDEIVKALEEYGGQTMELQNMDREIAWWDNVKQEINNL
jgi:hypothetical protein